MMFLFYVVGYKFFVCVTNMEKTNVNFAPLSYI
jgi:hypothetical protein